MKIRVQGPRASAYNPSIQEAETSWEVEVHSSPSLPTLKSSRHQENGQDTSSEVFKSFYTRVMLLPKYFPIQESHATKQMKAQTK